MPFKGTSQINKRIECCACLFDWDLGKMHHSIHFILFRNKSNDSIPPPRGIYMLVVDYKSALLSQTLAGNANCMMSSLRELDISLGRQTDTGRNNLSEHCSRKGMVSHVPHEVHAMTEKETEPKNEIRAKLVF
ncbi:hypothetical protein V6N13_007618 [Hibiscus sabdariffa]|uniref:Uncharacterized protein n=1 Tax=Hibiscus sabdariffa TaxID=183260 RepID=A0ABR2EPY3_9ROSI